MVTQSELEETRSNTSCTPFPPSRAMHRQCGPRCQKYDASRLQQCLHKAVLSSNVNLIEETLEDIAGLAFLASDLRASSICREVGKLRKHSDSKIKERAIFIIKRWKKIFECEKSAPTSPVPYTADQSSSTSTSSSPTSSSSPSMSWSNYEAYSITFCDRAENHAGMQMIGNLCTQGGFQVAELERAAKKLSQLDGIFCHLYRLEELLEDKGESLIESERGAVVLLIRGAVDALLSPEETDGDADDGNSTTKLTASDLLNETRAQNYDTKALMGRGANRKVKNKHARHNNCIADFSQEPDYEAGKGTVVAFDTLPVLSRLRKQLMAKAGLGPKASMLLAEVNKYYNTRVCGIGWHGDTERRLVVGVRLGEATRSMPLKFQWFQMSRPLGRVLEITLEHGDMYVMSEKATGFDWMSNRKGKTLRHAAGADKYAKNK